MNSGKIRILALITAFVLVSVQLLGFSKFSNSLTDTQEEPEDPVLLDPTIKITHRIRVVLLHVLQASEHWFKVVRTRRNVRSSVARKVVLYRLLKYVRLHRLHRTKSTRSERRLLKSLLLLQYHLQRIGCRTHQVLLRRHNVIVPKRQ